MKRDISNIQRVLDKHTNNDIIYRKHKIMEVFNADPDIKYILNRKQKLPLNRYADEKNPTEAELKERERIVTYNKAADKSQILPWLKINEIQKEVQNFIMFDIQDSRQSYTNEIIKHQILEVICLVHEDDMETEFEDVTRADLLSYLVVDLINWSNFAGLHFELQSNTPQITDTHYYGRILKFLVKGTNTNNFRSGRIANSYE